MHRSPLCWLVVFSLSLAVSSAQNTSVGLKPMNELQGDWYKGFQGGLYPNGQNVRPRAHDSAGRAFAQLIKPLDTRGSGDLTNGKIVLLSIGMSNTTQEFSVFKQIADTDRAKNPRLAIVDGAQGGQTAAIISSPSANFWTVVDQRLTASGVTRMQVQVVWIKEADANPTQAFPTHAMTLQHELETIARIVKSLYPNVRVAYVSSRTYAGYATTSLNPEPFAHESGFSVKWMIEKQIGGDTSLAYGGSFARSPWLAWGPYLWVDGTTQRSDGLVWQATDTQSDGTHPSASGCLKVATLLLNFFKSDPTASSWFLKTPATGISAEQREIPNSIWLTQNYPNPFNGTTNFEFRISSFEFVTLRIHDVLGREVATLVNRELPPGTYHIPFTADHLPSGVYFCRLEVGKITETRSMLLLK
ncbi:MAG: T9SS type A sorting domain-containing protein [Ignavibacteriales bacterium]|nr:T9SS type A sorting domain-containing protein [Ignavibacteriales bacterium]